MQQPYAQQTNVPVVENCNGITIINVGTTICTVNGEQIQPGNSKSIGGNEMEIYKGRCDIAFMTLDKGIVPAAQTTPVINCCYVTQKFYVGPDLYDRIN